MSDSEPEHQVPSGSLWVNPSIDVEWHRDWDKFRAYIDQYQGDTRQIFRQRTSTRCRSETERLKDARRDGSPTRNGNSDDSSGASERLIPEDFKNVWIKLVYTHGWTRKSRGKGIRKSFFDISTGCKANIKAAVTWYDDEDVKAFMVRVTGFSLSHNHSVPKATYENHASNHRVPDPNVLAFVDELQAAGSKPIRIMRYLRKRTDEQLLPKCGAIINLSLYYR